MQSKYLFQRTKQFICALGFLISGCLMVPLSYAQENPRGLAIDNRIKVVPYEENNVVPVDASTFTTTQIVFGKNEIIENIQNGDLDAWAVSVQKGIPNMLFLKPTILNSHTNMTVVTNHHTYYFQLMSEWARAATEKITYAIHFTYPTEVQTNTNALLRYNREQQAAILNAHRNPAHYHWNYSFSGARSIMPLHIFDDGRFTYMQLQAGQAIPAIFAVDNTSGQESVVNYRREGQYIVIQQVAPQFTLREGKYHVASIFNNSLIRQLRE